VAVSIEWTITPEVAFTPGVQRYIGAIRRGVRAIAQRRAPEIENWMKLNAIWVDRTGNARQTLTAEVEDLALDVVQIVMEHGVEYGVWLELAHGGTYAILAPAIDYWGPIVWADVQALLR